MIADDTLPAAPHLFGDPSRHLLAQALEQLGGRLHELRLTQVVYRPGRELIVRYAATVAWGSSAPARETLFAGTTVSGPPPGTVPLEAGDLTVGMWRWPFDPVLPGLATAVTPSRAAALVSDLVGGTPDLVVRAYRPTRRLVVQATGPSQTVYLKVLPPREVVGVVARHDALTGRVPAPEILHADHDAGIVVLRALTGETVRRRLLHNDRAALRPAALLGILDELAATPMPAGATPIVSPRRTAVGHAALLRRVLPNAAPILDALLEGIGPPPSPGTEHVHGDLHDSQLTTTGSEIAGVLDLDDAGPGHRVDDLGNMLAHLSTLALHNRGPRPTIDAATDQLWDAFADVTDPHLLTRTTAAAAIGLATGPFAAQQDRWQLATRRRLALASRWLATT